jgi:hypothetical protein
MQPCKTCPNRLCPTNGTAEAVVTTGQAQVLIEDTGRIKYFYAYEDASVVAFGDISPKDVSTRFSDLETALDGCEKPTATTIRRGGLLGKLGLKTEVVVCAPLQDVVDEHNAKAVESYFADAMGWDLET